MRTRMVIALVSALTACTPGAVATPPDAASPDDGSIGPSDAGTDAPVTDENRATLGFGPHPISPGEERTVCVTLDAGNATARQVRAIRTHLPQGSHHMIVYRSEQPLNATPTPCFPFADGADAIFIAESVEGELVYPDDAALAFDAHQHVRLEIHEVNYYPDDIDITASVEFEFLPVDAPTR